MTADPIRDEAVKVLAEGLHAPCEAEWAIKASRGVTEMTLHGVDAHHRGAAAILDASPTLARRLSLGTAWDLAVAALPSGYGGPMLYPKRFDLGWHASAVDERVATNLGAEDVSVEAATPDDALAALAAKLGSGL